MAGADPAGFAPRHPAKWYKAREVEFWNLSIREAA
jgi:hypothetical protein